MWLTLSSRSWFYHHEHFLWQDGDLQIDFLNSIRNLSLSWTPGFISITNSAVYLFVNSISITIVICIVSVSSSNSSWISFGHLDYHSIMDISIASDSTLINTNWCDLYIWTEFYGLYRYFLYEISKREFWITSLCFIHEMLSMRKIYSLTFWSQTLTIDIYIYIWYINYSWFIALPS